MNEFVRKKINAQATILDEIMGKKFIWYGHVDRKE